MWRDAGPRAEAARERADPRDRDLLRRDGRRRRHRGRRAALLGRRLAGRAARAVRRRRARDRLATAPRARRAGHARGARRRGRRASTTSAAIAVTQGPGLVGALLVGLSAAKALAWARGLPLVPVDHLHGHVASLYLGPDPLEPPFTCLLASGGHTLLLAVRERVGFERARLDARRRRRRGVRQGRAAARARLPRRRRDRPARARRRPRGVRVPRRPRARPRLLVLRAQDRAALRRARPRRRRARAHGAPTSPPRTSARSSGRWSGGSRAAAEQTGARRRSRSSAASRRTPSFGPRCPTRRFAPLALCTDNAAMIASAARFADPSRPRTTLPSMRTRRVA